jgi:hypothetical protein
MEVDEVPPPFARLDLRGPHPWPSARANAPVVDVSSLDRRICVPLSPVNDQQRVREFAALFEDERTFPRLSSARQTSYIIFCAVPLRTPMVSGRKPGTFYVGELNAPSGLELLVVLGIQRRVRLDHLPPPQNQTTPNAFPRGRASRKLPQSLLDRSISLIPRSRTGRLDVVENGVARGFRLRPDCGCVSGPPNRSLSAVPSPLPVYPAK